MLLAYLLYGKNMYNIYPNYGRRDEDERFYLEQEKLSKGYSHYRFSGDYQWFL